MDGHTFTIHPCDAGCKNCKNTACIDYPKLEKYLAMGREGKSEEIIYRIQDNMEEIEIDGEEYEFSMTKAEVTPTIEKILNGNCNNCRRKDDDSTRM